MVIFFHLQSYFTWNAWDIKHQSFHWLSNFVILNRNWSLATNLNYIAGYKMKSFCASFPSLSPKRKKKKMPNVHTNLCLFYWVFEQCSIYLFPYWIIAINKMFFLTGTREWRRNIWRHVWATFFLPWYFSSKMNIIICMRENEWIFNTRRGKVQLFKWRAYNDNLYFNTKD